jgi:hypothetical protein
MKFGTFTKGIFLLMGYTFIAYIWSWGVTFSFLLFLNFACPTPLSVPHQSLPSPITMGFGTFIKGMDCVSLGD